MQESDRIEFAAYMKVAADLYGRAELSREALKMFSLLLQPYTIEQVKKALQTHMAESPYMPKPSDIKARIEGTADDRAALAWQIVLNAVRRNGHYDSIRFPSPAYHYAIGNMDGWISLCKSLVDENLPFRRKDFMQFFKLGEQYASWDAKPEKTQVPRYLAGATELNNRTRGLNHQPPVYDAVTGEAENLPELTATNSKNPLIAELLSGMKIKEITPG